MHSSIPNSPPANYAAGDFVSCVAGRLCVEIIRIAVDYHGSANDILHPKTVCSHHHLSAALLHHQRRQITGVPGMGSAIGIIVVARLRKACTGAAVSLMNVETKEAACAVNTKSRPLST